MRAALAAFAAVLLLTACGADNAGLNQDEGGADGVVNPILVDLGEGESVTCVVYDGVRAGGVDCDWEAGE